MTDDCPQAKLFEAICVLRKCRALLHDCYLLDQEVEHEYSITPVDQETRDMIAEIDAVLAKVGDA